MFERVRAEYVEEVTDEELIEAAINGMLTSLDPHSGYLDAKKYRDMQVQTKGEFGGLGIEVTMEDGLVKVVSPIDDTPAYRAGIQAGRRHHPHRRRAGAGHVPGRGGRADARPGRHLDRPHVAPAGRGRAVRRQHGARGDHDLAGALAQPKATSATSGSRRSTSRPRPSCAQAVDELQAELGRGMKGIVLDLRNNPGGLLDQAVAVADAFLDRGEIVSTRGRRPDSIQRFNARRGDLVEGVPMVVLINGGSASASEIVAGALQDHGRAIVMGTPSFGKGSVQTIMPLPGHGAIRLTTARYYTPAGTSIQAKGIVPDIEVHQARVEVIDRGRGAARGRSARPARERADRGRERRRGGVPRTRRITSSTERLDLLRGVAMFGSARAIQ